MATGRWKKLYLELKDGEHSSDQRENKKKLINLMSSKLFMYTNSWKSQENTSKLVHENI